jgi:hypothetical protein
MTTECIGDMKGARRLKKLEDTRLNIQENILIALDKISLIDEEIKQLTKELKG